MSEIEIIGALEDTETLIYLSLEEVRAGYPVETNSHVELVDLVKYLNLDRYTTYFVRSRVTIKNIGIFAGDILIVDRSLDVKEGDIVIAYHEANDLSLRKVMRKGGNVYLISTSLDPIIYTDRENQIWGIVTHNVHSMKRSKSL